MYVCMYVYIYIYIYIYIYASVFMCLNDDIFTIYFILYLQFSIFVISANIMYYYLSVLW